MTLTVCEGLERLIWKSSTLGQSGVFERTDFRQFLGGFWSVHRCCNTYRSNETDRWTNTVASSESSLSSRTVMLTLAIMACHFWGCWQRCWHLCHLWSDQLKSDGRIFTAIFQSIRFRSLEVHAHSHPLCVV